MKTVPTYTATIYVGTRIHHEPDCQSIDKAYRWLHDYCNEVGLCVTITPTYYIYTGVPGFPAPGPRTDGGEFGFIVGLINYPVFPVEPVAIRNHAWAIACGLLELYEQFRISIVYPDETVLVEEQDVYGR